MKLFSRLTIAVGALLLNSTAGAQPAAQTILVWSYGFSPHPLHLTAGRPVTLTFVNRSGGGHDFTAPAFFANAKITGGGAQNGEIDLAPHETKSVTLIPSAGTYRAHCGHFMHKQLGMSDEIVVD